MKSALFLTAGLFLGAATLGVAASDKKPSPASGAKDAAADNYPLKTCVVSDEPLGSMGDHVAYTHREAGKPDREIRFCCEGCVEDFRGDPAKYLEKLDAASAKKKASPKRKKTS